MKSPVKDCILPICFSCTIEMHTSCMIMQAQCHNKLGLAFVFNRAQLLLHRYVRITWRPYAAAQVKLLS